MEDADSGSQRARILRVATRCTSADQFVEAFARFCDGRTLFVSSLSTRPIGTRLPFVILLADGARAMRGQCEVIESYANPGNAYRRPGVKLALVELDDDSEIMLGRLQVARAARDARTSTIQVAASATEVPHDGPRPVPSLPPPPPGSQARAAAPLAPLPQLTRPAAGRMPALPPLPRVQGGPAEPRRVDPPPPIAAAPPRRPAAPAMPPPTDDTDDGWGDDGDSRPARAETAPPVVAEPAPFEPAEAAPGAPTDEVEPDLLPESSPAMIVSPVPARAAAAVAADPMDAVPVVELTHLSQKSGSVRRDTGGVRRDTGGVPRERALTASGRVADRSSRHSTTGGLPRPTPGDVYSPEERTPGSTFILPANPLSNLTDESLQGFIDCTIYEDPTASPPEPAFDLGTSDPAISGSSLGMVEEPEPDFRPISVAVPVIELVPTPSIVVDAALRERERRITGSMSGEISIPSGLEPAYVRAVSQPLASIDDEDDEDELLPPAVAASAVVVAPMLIASVAAQAATPGKTTVTAPAKATEAAPAKASVAPPAKPADARPGKPGETRPGKPFEIRPSRPGDNRSGKGKPGETKPPRPIEAKPAKPPEPKPPEPKPPEPKPPEAKGGKPDLLVTNRVRAGTSRPGMPLPEPPAAKDSAPDWMSSGTPVAPPRLATKPAPKPASRRGLIAMLLLAAVAVVVVLYLRQCSTGSTTPSGGAARGRDAVRGPDAGVATAVTIDAGTPVAPAAIDAGVAGGACHLQVTTTPTGAAVTIDKRALGAAPIELDVDCGPVQLAARLPRFAAGTRQLTLTAGAPAVVNFKLVRPTHHLTVLSTPKGATVWIDGKPVGVTPVRSFAVPGFTRHTLTIELPGYAPHKTSVTTDDEEQTVAVPLVKAP